MAEGGSRYAQAWLLWRSSQSDILAEISCLHCDLVKMQVGVRHIAWLGQAARIGCRGSMVKFIAPAMGEGKPTLT